jgi:hypothetical protein
MGGGAFFTRGGHNADSLKRALIALICTGVSRVSVENAAGWNLGTTDDLGYESLADFMAGVLTKEVEYVVQSIAQDVEDFVATPAADMI